MTTEEITIRNVDVMVCQVDVSIIHFTVKKKTVILIVM